MANGFKFIALARDDATSIEILTCSVQNMVIKLDKKTSLRVRRKQLIKL